jgi:hypothetical protein
LLEKMRVNREGHADVFERATAKYRKRMEEHLEQMLDDVRNRRPVSHRIDMPVPEDHTIDYDRVIAMLEMSIEDVIVLFEQDFNCYVMDQWAWTAAFTATSTAYLVN